MGTWNRHCSRHGPWHRIVLSPCYRSRCRCLLSAPSPSAIYEQPAVSLDSVWLTNPITCLRYFSPINQNRHHACWEHRERSMAHGVARSSRLMSEIHPLSRARAWMLGATLLSALYSQQSVYGGPCCMANMGGAQLAEAQTATPVGNSDSECRA